jgi:hypothetical protein
MDEVRIWGNVRSGEEIYRDRFCKLSGTESNLVGYWNFDDGTANDQTGRSHNGTLNAGAQTMAFAGNDDVHAGTCGCDISLNVFPQSQMVVAGRSALFTASVSTTNSYVLQWLFNGNVINGATNPVLQVNNVQVSKEGNYAVVTTGNFGSVTGTPAVLAVSPVPIAPTITSQPQGLTIFQGSNVHFSANVNGTETLDYQWRKEGLPLYGYTNLSMIITNATSTDSGNYDLVVTNDSGSVTSEVTLLTVQAPPSILSNLVSQSVVFGQAVTLGVAVTGSQPMTFQWLFNSNVLASATNMSFTLTNVQPSKAGNYWVVVSNAFGVVTSQVATLTVLSPPTITSQPAGTNIIQGGQVSLSVAASGSAPMFFQWYCQGIKVPDSTNSSLILTNIQQAQEGNYYAVMTNIAGRATSAWAVVTVIDAGRALNAPNLTWLSGGILPWVIQTAITHDGQYAMRSGAIGDGQYTYLQTTVQGPGSLSFWWKVDSEYASDLLTFKTNGVAVTNLSGSVNWQKYAQWLDAGSYVLQWEYAKDSFVSVGADAAWLDEVFFSPVRGSLPVVSNQTFRLTFPTSPNKHYRVQYIDAVGLTNWQMLPSVSGDGNDQSVTDTNAVGTQRYYRLRVD